MNDVQLAGDKISRRHAQIARQEDFYTVADLGSRNGVIVNGHKIDKTVLASGDRIEIGNVLLLFELDESEDFPTQGFDAHADAPDKLPSGEPVLFSEDARASAEHFEESVNVVETGQLPPEQLLARLIDANRKLKALHDVSDALHDTFDLHELMHKVLDLVLDILEAERAVILLYEPDGRLRPASARNRHKTTARLAVSQTVVDYVARRMRSVISADPLADPRFDPSESLAV